MKRFLFTTVLFCLFSSIVSGEGGIMRILPGSAPAVFLPKEKLEIALEPAGADAKKSCLEIRDYKGRIVFARECRKNKAAGSQKFTIPMNRFGVFHAILTLHDEKDALLKKEELTFARIRDVRLKKPNPDSPFGIGAYYAMRFSPGELPIAAKIQNLLGAAWDRDELLWDIVEPEKEKWTWEKTDRAIRTARENNILILGLLDYWGKWTTPLTDQGVADYANYVKTMVSRYRPGGEFSKLEGWKDGYGISHWEIWNEPATFWTGSGEQFGKLMKAAYRAAKQADPDCQVFFSEAGEAFNRGAIGVAGPDSLDGVTPHYYCPPRKPEEGGVDIAMKNTPGNFEKLGVKGKPFWVSEFGWHSTMDPGQMSNQAICLVRSHVYGLAAGLDKFFWYNFINDTPNKNDHHFGLINREDWTPRYGFGAFAAMVYFLEGTTFKSRIEIVKPARIFVFEKGSGSVGVLWSSGADGTLEGDGLEECEIFDMMGNPLPSKKEIPLGEEPVYLVAEKASGEELSRKLEKAEVKGISPANLEIFPLSGALKNLPSVTVGIENMGRETIGGTLRIEPPETWVAEAKSVKVSPLAPGEKARYAFRFEKMSPAKDNLYPVSVTFRDTRGNEAVHSSTLSELVAAYGTPSIDGDETDWEKARFITLDSIDYAVGLVPYMDWNLSTRFALMWDEENLYFLGIVRDNAFDQVNTGSLIWEGDSFQLGFDCANAGESLETGEGQYNYGLAKTKKGDETWSWPVGQKKSDRPAGDIHFVFGNPKKDTYIYEAAIPKRLLSPLEMKDGARFGFTLLLNDNDGGGRRGWLELTPGIGTGFNPSYFTSFTLEKSVD